jgi:hypothetical protein
MSTWLLLVEEAFGGLDDEVVVSLGFGAGAVGG